MFGWHVHEKALLLAVIPLTWVYSKWTFRKYLTNVFFRLLINISSTDCAVFAILSTVATYSVFPLLFEPFEFLTKTLLLLLNVYFLFKSGKFNSSNIIERYYLISLGPLLMFTDIGLPLFGVKKKYPFLPLLLTSFHNSIGVLYCWFKYYYNYVYYKFKQV